jgi:hypothetical protein
MDLTMMERVGDRWEKIEGYCSTGQSPPWAVVPMEEEEEEEESKNKVLFLMCSENIQSVGCFTEHSLLQVTQRNEFIKD